MSDPWARAAAVMARGPGGVDAEYQILGRTPGVPIRVVIEREDIGPGQVGRPIAALVPADAEQLGRLQRGDTMLVTLDGEPQILTVEQAVPRWRGWAWRLSFSKPGRR